MSRYDERVSLTEIREHVRVNRERARTMLVRRCTLKSGLPGVAMTSKGFVLMLSTEDAISLADGLVDAVEAGQE